MPILLIRIYIYFIIAMKKISILLLLLCVLLVNAQTDIFSKYYKESRKIAQAMTLDELVGQMVQLSFEGITEKLRQVTNPQEAVTLFLGSLLIDADCAPTTSGNIANVPAAGQYEKNMEAHKKATLENWKRLTDRFQTLGVTVSTKDSGKYKIKFLLATDAVHGDQHTIGTILFPHNIGLSCSHNEGNFQNVGFWTKQALKKVGFNYAFAPTVAVSHNPQWGRFYQTMGQQEDYIEKYAYSYVKGLQDVSNDKINGVLSSAKHFFADGATLYGCNMGNANVLNFQNFINHNIRGYVGSSKANGGSVMASYSAINWIPNAINSQYLMGVLRQEAGFGGFVISDYQDLEFMNSMLLPRTFMNFTEEEDGYCAMVNAGVDMFMLAKKANVERLFKHAKKTVERGYIPQVRLVEAATRILTVKMAMGLIQKVTLGQNGVEISTPTVQISKQVKYPEVSSGNQYQDSLTAVHQSLVLIKNDNNLLPVTNLLSTIKYVVLIGEKIHNLNRLTKLHLFRNYDNIGMQNGGWTVRWQGFEGNDFWTGDAKTKTNASSILDALIGLQKKNNFELVFANYTNVNSDIAINQDRTKFLNDLKTKRANMTYRNTIIIGTFGQFPYAESLGDVNIPYCQTEERKGCLYEPSQSTYAPEAQLKTLKVDISKYDREVLASVQQVDKKIPLVSVLVSGRPMIVDELLSLSSATLAAWLPGTSGGQGIVDAIVGNYVLKPGSAPNKNTLSFDWPRDMSSLENFPNYESDGTMPRINDPLFKVGYGLSTQLKGNIISEQ